MGDAKRWSVTYAKHIKQKRKIYQDGFLELHDSSHKIMLYDDCEKLLVCSILKNDDVVKSGETLAFSSYLVDIGDLDGDHKTVPNLNLPESGKRTTEKAGLIHKHKFKHNSVPIDRKPESGKSKIPSTSLSPSQKIIREFKKNEMNKYGAPRNFPDHTKASFCEWNVLYTTQITQKAKKYHDGILRVATCGSQQRQVTLYDVSRRLLDSRFLKKDEVIGSGESLALDGHLVDIGEPEGDHKHPVDMEVQRRNCIEGGKIGLSHGQQTQPSTSIGTRNFGTRNIVSAAPNYLKAVEASLRDQYKEWTVLYTAQITQKAKKYHDGILRVATCGYKGRQVTLYDVGRRQLDSRFLKKDEVIGSGESLALDGHLVDIGEPEVDHKHPVEMEVQGRKCIGSGKIGLSHGQLTQPSTSIDIGNSGPSNSMAPLNCHKAVKTSMREWYALYTTQVTQKAKKYHNGILRLASCNSYQMQATLLNEDGAILSHKFLKLSEDVRSGSTFELPKYFVEVGEPRLSPEGGSSKSACSNKDAVSKFTAIGVGNFKLGGRVSTDNPVRDASGILSILKKSMTQEGSVLIKGASVKEDHALQSSKSIQFDPLNQAERHAVQDSNCENGEAENYGEETSKSLKQETLVSLEVTKVEDSENIGESLLKYTFMSSSSLRSGASDSSRPEISNAECTEKSISRPVSPVEKPHILDAPNLTCPDSFPPPIASLPHDGMKGNFLELTSLIVSSSSHGNPFSEPEESVEIQTRLHDGDFSSCIANSNGCKSHDPSNTGRQNVEENKSASKMDEIPTFDLGF